MKLYNHAHAPNPRRVRIFAAEKGIELPLEEVDILAGQSRTSEFLAKNSSGAVPVLELDDGSHLSESVAICRYLEGLHPEPNLLGRDLREQAEIERWNRRMELELLAPIGRTFQNTNPIFQRRIKQFPEYGEAQRAIVYQRLERMEPWELRAAMSLARLWRDQGKVQQARFHLSISACSHRSRPKRLGSG